MNPEKREKGHPLGKLLEVFRIEQLLERLSVQVGAGHQEVLQAVRDAVDAKVAVKKDFTIADSSEHSPEAEHQRLGVGAVKLSTDVGAHAHLQGVRPERKHS